MNCRRQGFGWEKELMRKEKNDLNFENKFLEELLDKGSLHDGAGA